MALGRETEITWLGHATVLITTPGGKRLVIDPWLTDNPACPTEYRQLAGIDGILITHGHYDHLGDAVPLAASSDAPVVAIHEVATWLQSQGVQKAMGMNKGGSVEVAGVRATMVPAEHSGGISAPDGAIVAGGEAAGYVLTLENGFRIYHAGDTALFSDMRLIGERQRPELGFLPIGDLFTMGPADAAEAARWLGLAHVVPIHYGTFPALTGTAEAFQEAAATIPGLEVHVLAPGESLR